MTRPLAPAEVPAWAWSDMDRLPMLRHQRERLIDDLRRGCARSHRGLLRRRRLAELTRDILAREARLAALNVNCALYQTAAARPFHETEH